MRKRYLLAASAAVAVLGTAGVLYAETPEGPGQSGPPQTDASAVTLPTGDVVKMTPQGTVGVSPAEGREDTGFFRAPAPDGDIIMVPTDRTEDLKAGEEDPRRYNVSALLEAGVTDASQATESQLDNREYRGLSPANAEQQEPSAEAQEVTVTIKEEDGSVPAFDGVMWGDLEADKNDWFEFDDNGVGTVKLEPGSYDLHAMFGDSDPQDGEGGDLYSGISTFTVTDEPVDLTLDGGEAEKVSTSVDNDEAETTSQKLEIASPDADIATYALGPAEGDHYVLPSESGGSNDLQFQYVETLATGDDAAEPALYNLAFVEEQGVPDDLDFTVADSELAVIDTDFESFGADTDEGFYCMGGTVEDLGHEFHECYEAPLTVGQNRTVYYTPSQTGWFGYSGIGTEEDFLMSESLGRQIDEAGDSTQSPHSAPFTVGSSAEGFQRDAYAIYLAPSMIESFDPHTSGFAPAVEGSITVSHDGEELDSYEGPFDESFPVEVAGATEGRFTVEAEGGYQGEATPIGTSGKATWEFDASAVSEDDGLVPVDASSVYLDAEGVENGVAEAGTELPVTAEYRSHGEEEAALEDLSFDVSYDEGDSWDEVDAEQDGNSATAALQTPEDAESVSVRFTASDDLGSTVQQETLRSFLLK